MTQTTTEVDKELLESFLKANSDLLIPRLFITNRWALKNSTGKSPIYTIAMYIARPIPLIQLNALHDALKQNLVKLGINPSGKMTVGVRHHRPILNLSKRKMLVYNNKNKPFWIYYSCLTYRSPEKFTMVVFPRNLTLHLHNDCNMRNSIESNPVNFIKILFNNINYPEFIILEAINCNTTKRLAEKLNTIRWNHKLGWRIQL